MDKHLYIAETWARLMDAQFGVGKFRFGLDPLLDLIPGFGTIAGSVLSFYIVWIGIQMKLPQDKIAHMIGNIAVDFVIGLVPFIGALGDVFYKANLKNLQIIKDYTGNTIRGQIASSH